MSTPLPSQPATPETPGKIAKTIGYYAAFITLGLTTASLGPTLPGLAEHTRANLSEISFLFTARSLGYLLGSLQGGRMYDRLPGHSVMVGVLVMMGVILALVPMMPLLWLLTAILLLLGIAEGIIDVGGNTLLVWVHRHEVGPFMNGLHFFFGVGAFISPILIAQTILISGDITWAYWMLALLVLPVLIWVSRLPSPDSPSKSEEGTREEINPFLVTLVALFLSLYVGAEVSFGGWIFTYATTLNLSGTATAAYLTSGFWGALTLGRLLAIPIAARIRPRGILLADLMGCLASLVVILAWPGSLTAVWLGTLGLGFFMASIFPTTITFAGRRMTITGKVTGLFFVGASTGGMFLPWFIGQIFESIGPWVTMVAISVDLVLALGVFTALFSYSKRLAPPKESLSLKEY